MSSILRGYLPECWGTCPALSEALITFWFPDNQALKGIHCAPFNMDSSQPTAQKCAWNLRHQMSMLRNFPWFSLDTARPLKEQYLPLFCRTAQTLHPSILCPFTPPGVPMATHSHPGGSNTCYCERVGQSRQRHGSLKSNFTSEVQPHYEKINNPKRPLWLRLVK